VTWFKLPEITYPLHVDTIGKVLALDGEIDVYCNTCAPWRGHRLNLVAIAKRHGIDYSSMHWDLIKVVYCPECRTAGRSDKNLSFQHRTNHLPRCDVVTRKQTN